MKIQTGYLYHIKDSYFRKINESSLMINHEKGHSRPSYLAIKDKEILWFIPLSSKIDKYKHIIEEKQKKYGQCKSIMIEKIAHQDSVILIQNAFPTLEKYVKSQHTVDGELIKVTPAIQKKIINNFQYLLSLKRKGLNLFFTDIDAIKKLMFNELKTTSIK